MEKSKSYLAYQSPFETYKYKDIFINNRKQMSISGVQEKFSVVLKKNKLSLVESGEHGQYILKPIPSVGKTKKVCPLKNL